MAVKTSIQPLTPAAEPAESEWVPSPKKIDFLNATIKSGYNRNITARSRCHRVPAFTAIARRDTVKFSKKVFVFRSCNLILDFQCGRRRTTRFQAGPDAQTMDLNRLVKDEKWRELIETQPVTASQADVVYVSQARRPRGPRELPPNATSQ